MAAVALTSDEKALLDTFDPVLEQALAEGANLGASVIVPATEGYGHPRLTADLKAKLKRAFRATAVGLIRILGSATSAQTIVLPAGSIVDLPATSKDVATALLALPVEVGIGCRLYTVTGTQVDGRVSLSDSGGNTLVLYNSMPSAGVVRVQSLYGLPLDMRFIPLDW